MTQDLNRILMHNILSLMGSRGRETCWMANEHKICAGCKIAYIGRYFNKWKT